MADSERTILRKLGIASGLDVALITGVTPGTVTASKALVVDANKDIASLRNITATGLVSAATVTTSGQATLNSAAITANATVGGTLGVTGITTIGTLRTTARTGTVASVTGLSAVEGGHQFLHRTLFTFSNVVIPVTHGAGTDGYGTLKIYDFPTSVALIRHGAHLALSTITGDANISATSAFTIGAGVATQTSNNGGAFVSNGDSFTSSGSAVTLTASVGSVAATGFAGNTAVLAVASRSIYLNVFNVDTTASGTLTISGTFTLLWSNLDAV